jgi:S-formylglutathione hydrolase
VVPNAIHGLGGSWYRNNELTGNWGNFVAVDLVTYVDSHFRTQARPGARAIAGHGMGGTGALELALDHPQVFGSVYAMSPAILERDGLKASGLLTNKRIAAWNSALDSWSGLPETERKRRFRDYVQAKLNTSSADEHMQGLLISCAAAFAFNRALPFPHFALSSGAKDQPSEDFSRALESGLGDWEIKLKRYAALKFPLQSIVIEYGRNDEHQWIRRGSEQFCTLMNTQGIPCDLQVSEGGHDSTLGQRLEATMLPAVSNSFRELK